MVQQLRNLGKLAGKEFLLVHFPSRYGTAPARRFAASRS
jgi:hypothetical protein